MMVTGGARAGDAAKAEPRFQVPPGFVVEKVAGPPLIRYPLFAALDDRGRLFVAEGTGTNFPGDRLVKMKKQLGRIMLLEDTDGDGKFDTSKVFADDLVFPTGVLWHDGALYATSHPSLWRFVDTKGTGHADRREALVSRFNFNGNGCDIHGPFLGPEGRLYWTDGRHGYKVRTRQGEVLEGLASRIWRCRTDGTEIERLCGGGFDNPVEIAFTADGEAIGTMDQGPGDCLLHYVEGGVYPMEHPCLKEFAMTGPLLGPVKRYSVELPAALCGLTSYRSDLFGDEYKDCLFSTHYMVHKIVRHTLIREGSTFRAEDKDFLTTMSHDVRLTDVLEDADGSLLCVDMGAWFTYGFLGNPLPKPEALGAIYRIRRTGVPPVVDPWGQTLNLPARSPAELAPLLQDRRPRVQDQVIERLGKHGAAAVPALEAVLRANDKLPLSRRNAVWALCRIRTPEAHAAIRLGFADPDLSVRLAATHAAGVERDAEALAGLCHLVRSAEPPLRRKAAEALGLISRPEAVPALLDGLRKGGDRFLEHSLIYALIRINDRQATLPALADANPRVRQAGLIALDQMKDGNLTQELVTPLLEANDADLQHAALEVISKRPAWSGLAQGAVEKLLGSGRLSPVQERSLTELLLASSGEANLQKAAAASLANPRTPSATRLLLLGVVAQYRQDPLPAPWLAALGRALTDRDVAILRETVGTIKTRNLRQFDQQLLELSRQAGLPADVRIAALECLAGRHQQLDPEAFAFLSTQLAETVEPLLRQAAARTLGASTLSHPQLLQLAAATKTLSTVVLRVLLPVFAKVSDPKVGAALVEALQNAPPAEALSVAELDKTLKGYPAEVREQAQTLRRKLAARQKGQAAYLARLTAELAPLRGDRDAGQELFLSPRIGCFGCHRAAGRGGHVGPDLSRIGQLRTKAELLESIIFPSFTIAPEYRSYQVAAKDGRVVTGLILRETAEALSLRTTDLAEIRIARKDIEEMTPSNVSIMPDGLEKVMNRQELRDLLEFLSTQK
jgi:putative heme-binding domain-containing protein